MDTMERLYIYKETYEINDKDTAKPNIIFDTIVNEEATRAHTTS